MNFSSCSTLKGNEKEVIGVLDSYKINSNQLTIKVKYEREFIVAFYYFEAKDEMKAFLKHAQLGTKIKLLGSLQKPLDSRVENGFSYRKYLQREKTYYLMKVENEEILNTKIAFQYHIKNFLNKRMQKLKSGAYLQTFLLGNDENIEDDVKTSFRNNGISHLFAISGMHISLMSGVLLFLLKKFSVKEKMRYCFVSGFLLLYLFLTFSPSVLRATLFFILFSINKLAYFYIKPFHLFLLTLSICLLIHPYFIYMVGFQYSFLNSGILIFSSEYINQGNSYIHKLLRTSALSFVASSIVSLFHFYELNFFSVFYNLFYVPFVSLLVFPLSFLTFLCPLFDSVFILLIAILEKTSLFLENVSFGKVIFGKPSFLLLLCYFFLLFLFMFFVISKKKAYYILFFPFFIFYYSLSFFNQDNYLLMLDVGQGDSVLLQSRNHTILVDTGGIQSFQKKGFERMKQKSIVEQTTIPYLKSKGIRKIDALILTHGDYDHLGEAEKLLSQFPVKKVYLNNNQLNYFEQRLSKKYKVEHFLKDSTLEIGDFSFYSLNGDLEDENDSSLVLLLKVRNKKILLMGDASERTEKEIIKEYTIGKVDILKVGHHGSKTSSCHEFLDEISPDVAMISAGRDNRFHHPHSIVLERFRKRKIKYFITSKMGSIRIDF